MSMAQKRLVLVGEVRSEAGIVISRGEFLCELRSEKQKEPCTHTTVYLHHRVANGLSV